MLKLIVAVAVAGTLGSLTDWLFMGVLFHGAYERHPEVWRPNVRGGGERGAVLWAAALGYAITAAVVALVALARIHGLAGALLVAALMWTTPAVVIVVNGLFIKIDPKITVAHCLGYGARLILAGAGAAVALG